MTVSTVFMIHVWRLYSVAHNLTTQNIFVITSECNELGATNFTCSYCNKLTMCLVLFTKYHEISFSGSKDMSSEIWALKIPPYTKLASTVKNRFLAKLFNKLFYAYIRLLFVTRWIKTYHTQPISTVVSFQFCFQFLFGNSVRNRRAHRIIFIHTDIWSVLCPYLLTPFL